MVAYMILWLLLNARGIRSEVESHLADALAAGSGGALVAMAFLAVLREGLETAVFLVALFQQASDRSAGVLGAIIGLTVAVLIGYGLYRGGVRLNLARFFPFTGIV